MIQYDGHLSANNNCQGEHEFVPDQGDGGTPGGHVDAVRAGSGPADARCIDTDYARSLSTLIESEIIPRLMVAHATAAPATAIERKAAIEPEEVADFAPLVMQIEADALLVHVEAILTRGVAIDVVLVDLLAPTARLLGKLWEDERCDFVEVTMGFWRLQEVVHELSRRLPAGQGPVTGDRPGAGARTADGIFRRDEPLADRLGEVAAIDSRKRMADRFDIIGLTVSCDCHRAQGSVRTTALRNVSRSRQV